MPPVSLVGPGHFVRCFKHEEIAKLERGIDNFAAFQANAERTLKRGLAPLSV
jgi:hypothetical protein